jgi:putative effector of murein hydrolase LrgA (UPF0299 family)
MIQAVLRKLATLVTAVLILTGFYAVGGWAEHEADRLMPKAINGDAP